jgi:hypothetical protein
MKRKLSELKGWDKNPRGIKDEDYKRLKAQIQDLGLYKPFIITEDGTVLGGNMRLRAAQELGIDEVPVSVVKADTEELKLKYALSDNDRAGYYEEDKLAELVMSVPDIDLGDYGVDLGDIVSIKQLLERFNQDSDWAEVFEAEGNTQAIKDFEQITFVIGKSDMIRLKEMLHKYSNNKNEAVVGWLDDSEAS